MKKIMFIMMVLFFVAATAVSAQEVQSGEFTADYNSADYSLHQEKGTRSYDVDVSFTKSFESVPKIVLSVTMIDADNRYNTRYKVEAKSVSRDGFTIKVTTWNDSKVWGIAGNWMAHSE